MECMDFVPPETPSEFSLEVMRKRWDTLAQTHQYGNNARLRKLWIALTERYAYHAMVIYEIGSYKPYANSHSAQHELWHRLGRLLLCRRYSRTGRRKQPKQMYFGWNRQGKTNKSNASFVRFRLSPDIEKRSERDGIQSGINLYKITIMLDRAGGRRRVTLGFFAVPWEITFKSSHD